MPEGGVDNRPRVIISAFGCGPVDEPEAMAAWAIVRAAAVNHDVWFLTRRRFSAAVTEALADDPELAAHITPVYIDLSEAAMARARRPWDLYWYYAIWQRLVTREARRLHSEIRFDIAHHVTFANDWLPCGLAELGHIPFIWGPVGGASRMPVIRLARWLGPRGTAVEVLRAVGTWLPRRLWGHRAARRAALVIAQNRDVADHFRFADRIIVEPNAALGPLPERRLTSAKGGQRTAVFAGRLIGLKSPRLAVSAIAQAAAVGWRLDIYGDGYERDRVRRLAERLGVLDRIAFHGHRPRAEVLEAYASADALLFPSLHDQAGWAVAEASSIGCPVVCLPLGGPPILAERNARVASLDGDIAENLATELAGIRPGAGTPHRRWDESRMIGLVDEWYADALMQSSDSRPAAANHA